MANKEKVGEAYPLCPVKPCLTCGKGSAGIGVESAQELDDIDHVLGFIQFSLTGRGSVEMNEGMQVGCAILLEKIRDTIRQIKSHRC